jgi:hypothetical protein
MFQNRLKMAENTVKWRKTEKAKSQAKIINPPGAAQGNPRKIKSVGKYSRPGSQPSDRGSNPRSAATLKMPIFPWEKQILPLFPLSTIKRN